MAIIRTAPFKATEPKAQRGSRRRTDSAPGPAPIPVFDTVAHQKEIAQQPGSPEEDWLKAEAEIRAKYTR